MRRAAILISVSAALALTGGTGAYPARMGTAKSGSTPSFKVRRIGPDVFSRAFGINADGQIVGGSCNTENVCHAFLWQHGKATDLGVQTGLADAINARGEVVGENGHAFLWQNGKTTDLGALGGGAKLFSEALAINNRGQVVGQSGTGPGPDGSQGFLWQNGKMIDLGTLADGTAAAPYSISSATAINDSGQIVGWSSTDTGPTGDHAVLWQNGKIRELGGFAGRFAEPTAINNRGQIVGQIDFSSVTRTHPFLWQNGNVRDLALALRTAGCLTSAPSVATGINESGEIVGNCYLSAADVAAGRTQAWIWQDGHATDLGGLGGIYNASAATGIASNGDVVGYASEVASAGRPLRAVEWTPQ